MVSTASYEARRFGIHSAMPIYQARKLCPHGIFIPGRMQRYVEKSREIMALLQSFSPLVEKASVDEAYLDATGLERLFGSAVNMAEKLQAEVLAQTGLSCSLGLAPVKFLAKIASDMKKPAGLTILAHADVAAFLQTLPVGKIPGVGTRMRESLARLGIRMAADVQRYPAHFWQEHLGKAGLVLHERARGIDPRPVQPVRDPQSESAENTFAEDTRDPVLLSAWLLRQAERVGKSLRVQNLAGRTVTLKLKYADFSQKTRSRTLPNPTNSTRLIYETALELLEESNVERLLRLIGLGVSQFGAEVEQLSLFPDAQGERKKRDAALDGAVDAVRDKFGAKALVRGKLFGEKKPE